MSTTVTIYVEEGKEYYFNPVRFIEAHHQYAHNKNVSLETVDILIHRKTGMNEDTVKNHRSFYNNKYKCPRFIETCKEYGKILANDPYAFLIPCSSDEVEFLERDLKVIFNCLYKVLCLYKVTNAYNIPANSNRKKDQDPRDCIEVLLDEATKSVNILFLFRQEVRDKLLQIIEDVRSFAFKYEVLGVPDEWVEKNPNLRFYHCAFEIKEQEHLFSADQLAKVKKMLDYYPTDEEVVAKNEYFSLLEKNNQIKNLRYSMDDFYQQELVKALSRIFEDTFK